MTETAHRVLIVDDVEYVTALFAELLERHGFSVATAPSAPVALEAARAERFDLVISDIGMPGLSGYELAAQLRTLPEYRAIPLLAVSGFGEYDDRGRALHAGFDEYLSKPVQAATLLETVERLLSGRPAGALPHHPEPWT